jgi:FkbM family methyltransferase
MRSPTEATTDLTLAGRPVKFVGDPGEHYFKSLAAFHAAAPRLEYYLRKHIRRDALCLDIGSNIGLTAILLSIYCPEGRIYCFEASPKNARNLRRNLELNDIKNCIVIESAVGERSGTLNFCETEFCAGSHVVSASKAALQRSNVIAVPVLTIDRFLETERVASTRVDFIKIDVEGFEPAVLAGASCTIERSRCPIFMEFNFWCLLILQNFNPLAFATTVLDAFDVRRVDDNGSLVCDADSSVGGFLYGNLFRNGCVDDLIIQLKAGKRVPSLAEMTKYGEDLSNVREIAKLRSDLAGLRDAAA